jgi:DNA-binding response OmpR family regulator
MSSRILIVEDERNLASFLEKALGARGYATALASTGPEALARAREAEFDLIVLDLGLPGLDGTEVLRILRTEGQDLPILILSARDEVGDKVVGLNLGADDNLAKPFEVDELLARVAARLRAPTPGDPMELRVGALRLDLRGRRAELEGRRMELSAREFALLELLMRHPEQVLSREQILAHVWGYDFDPGSNVVDVYIGYLRRKFGPDRIATVRGMGYRLNA